MQKTLYICDRCGKESEDSLGWTKQVNAYNNYPVGKSMLCPSCSKRALEKPGKPLFKLIACPKCPPDMIYAVSDDLCSRCDCIPPVSKPGSAQS